ncbi:MAG: hypothetical protein J7L46_01800, partial [Bacteroidales bacterium]|nr:hypothetical protein [Bacteroidales bacterium]
MKKILLFASIAFLILLVNFANAQSDITPSSYLNLSDGCSNSIDTLSVILQNNGQDTVLTGDTLLLSYSVNGGTVYSDSLFLSFDWYPGDFASATFDSLVDLSAIGTYNFQVVCKYKNDTIPSNDTLNFSINTFGFPTTVISSDTTICAGNNVTLTVSGGDTYLWNTGDSIASIVVTPTDTTNYIVITTDTNSCQTSDTIVINVNPAPTIAFNVADTSNACQGNSVNITASGGNTYVWNTGDSIASIVVSPTDTTIYSVNVFLNGCSASDSVLVNLIAPAYTLIPDTFVCDGDSITLYANNGDSYVWSSGDSTETAAVLPTTSAEYYITISDANGCNFSDSILVDVHVIPTISTDYSDTTICSGATITSTASGANSYTWNNNAVYDSTTSNIAQLTPMTTTIFYVYGTTLGCTASSTVIVTVLQSPDLNLEDEYQITEDNILVLGVTGGYTTYNWSNGETDETIVLDGFILGSGTYSYWVNATASNGCFSSDTTTVIISDGVGFSKNNAQNQIK